jgi:hypothetical protein
VLPRFPLCTAGNYAPVFSWEIVLCRPGEADQLTSIKADNLAVGDKFTREGTTWIVTQDEGRSRYSDHVSRVVCEPLD